MAKSSATFVCAECGWSTPKWVGRCASCGEWGTVTEREGSVSQAGVRTRATRAPERAAQKITEVSQQFTKHTPTHISELDRVLGGGIVPGAAILLSGEPGVGKSTLLLDVAANIARQKARVLYASGEESTSQIRMRAERTGALVDSLFLASDTDLASVLGHIEAVEPDIIIVDSVQTIASADVDGIAGGPAQVREVASVLIRVAKSRNTPLILVGHVTKDGTVAGPRVLEHLVDTVCHFEGDRHTALRFLRSLKNRFGPTDEIGCFEMQTDGIVAVPDPSGLFLSRSTEPVSGTCVALALEGRRALPVEVQALVAPSAAPQPRRVTSGIDQSRVAMILAVLERRAGVKLHDQDVYVSTVGGVRLSEPGADLAIGLAIASAATGTPLSPTTAAVGELSLAGEVRPVVAQKQRVSEAQRLGYSTIIDANVQSIRRASEVAIRAGREQTM
jgi:DNA repair protein RadA/Sms